MPEQEKDPVSGSAKQKSGDPADRWANEGGAPEKKDPNDPKHPSMSAGTPRTGEDEKYEDEEGSAQERSEN